jgi:hypothetical protein
MALEGAIVSKLRATSGVTDITGLRIWPARRVQARDLPAITVQRVSGAPVYTNDGESGLAEARIQIDSWGATYTEAKNAARAVQTALSAFTGTVDSVAFRFSYLDTERDDQEGGGDEPEYLFRTSMDFMVMFDN